MFHSKYAFKLYLNLLKYMLITWKVLFKANVIFAWLSSKYWKWLHKAYIYTLQVKRIQKLLPIQVEKGTLKYID